LATAEPIAQHHIQAVGVADRVKVHAADLCSDPFGDG
jgi:hypothetical protein